MRIFFLVGSALPGIHLRELVLLSRNLNHQALAQIPRRHSGRIKVLHQFDAALNQIQIAAFPVQIAALGELPEGLGQFLVADGEVSIFVQVADDELSCLAQTGFERQRPKLPRQVIGKSGWLGKESSQTRAFRSLQTPAGCGNPGSRYS